MSETTPYHAIPDRDAHVAWLRDRADWLLATHVWGQGDDLSYNCLCLTTALGAASASDDAPWDTLDYHVSATLYRIAARDIAVELGMQAALTLHHSTDIVLQAWNDTPGRTVDSVRRAVRGTVLYSDLFDDELSIINPMEA